MNAATSRQHFMLDTPAPCEAHVDDCGVVFVTVDVDRDHFVTLSGPPAVVLTQLDAMRTEVVLAQCRAAEAETEAVTA